MAEGEEGSSRPHKNGSAQLILTVYSYRCNRTGLGVSQGRKQLLPAWKKTLWLVLAV